MNKQPDFIYLLVCLTGLTSCSSDKPPTTANVTPSQASSKESNESNPVTAEPPTVSEQGDLAEDSDDSSSAPQPDDEEASKVSASPRSVPQQAEEISFDDLNLQLQPDIVFRPWMLTERAKSLDGCLVRIAGYMLPHTKSEGIKSFVLLRNTECKFGPGGQPDHLISIDLRDTVTTKYRNAPIQVEGTIKIEPFVGPDGNTWAIYKLTDGDNIVTLRR